MNYAIHVEKLLANNLVAHFQIANPANLIPRQIFYTGFSPNKVSLESFASLHVFGSYCSMYDILAQHV